MLNSYAVPISAVDTHRAKPKAPEPVVEASTSRQYFAAEEETV
jgi:6-phosphofructo-2-kinase/fructose-2,6-biphosphatase 2